MKRIFLIAIYLIIVTACGSPQETPQLTLTPTPPTVTLAPTQTPTPIPTLTPSPTPTPEPYYLEKGSLYDLDDQIGEYNLVGEGVDAITTTADGVNLALDSAGVPRFVFSNDTWVEILIPEAAENYEELVVSDRYVSVVNEVGVVEEGLESGTKVLVDENGKFTHELMNGQWVKYKPRVMVVGEDMADIFDPVEVPREVIDTAAETVKNAEMIKRIESGEIVELKTGLDERWGEAQFSGNDWINWYGILCGSVEVSRNVYGYMGVEMNSGDILMINMQFSESDFDFSKAAIVFEDGLIPDIPFAGMLDTMGELGRVAKLRQIAIAVLETPIGTPLYFSSRISGDDFETERIKVWDAMKTGEFLGSRGSSIWHYGAVGASDRFWNLVESQ